MRFCMMIIWLSLIIIWVILVATRLKKNINGTKYWVALLVFSITLLFVVHIQIESILSYINNENIYISIDNNKRIIPNILNIMKYIVQILIIVTPMISIYLYLERNNISDLQIIICIIIYFVVLSITIYQINNVLNICTKQIESINIVTSESMYKVLNTEITIGRDNTETVQNSIDTNRTLLDKALALIDKEYDPELVKKCTYNLKDKEEELSQNLRNAKSVQEYNIRMQEYNNFVKTHHRVCLDLLKEQVNNKISCPRSDLWQPWSKHLSLKQTIELEKTIELTDLRTDIETSSTAHEGNTNNKHVEKTSIEPYTKNKHVEKTSIEPYTKNKHVEKTEPSTKSAIKEALREALREEASTTKWVSTDPVGPLCHHSDGTLLYVRRTFVGTKLISVEILSEAELDFDEEPSE